MGKIWRYNEITKCRFQFIESNQNKPPLLNLDLTSSGKPEGKNKVGTDFPLKLNIVPMSEKLEIKTVPDQNLTKIVSKLPKYQGNKQQRFTLYKTICYTIKPRGTKAHLPHLTTMVTFMNKDLQPH